jgi:NAD(P)-dependent dehydrogenase (short-subunit alcohol dehydrogenase family)
MNIYDKVCLITGSAARVGKSIAQILASNGAKIVIHYHSNLFEAENTANEITKMGSKVLLVRADISKKADWIAMKDLILKEWKKIDVLVNNAAIFYKTPFLKMTEKELDHFININLKGTLFGCQVIGKIMYQNKSGKIINIADVSADTVWPNYIPYCISKAGVIALTKGLAKSLAPYVTVNAISPGTVLLAENYDEVEENQLIKKTPLKRVGTPEDIANTVKFLIQDSDFINGAIIKVDGGRSLT